MFNPSVPLGARIIEDARMTVSKARWTLVRRSWRERLFSGRPGRMCIARKPVKTCVQVPSPNYFYLQSQGAFVCHPAMAQRLREVIAGIE